MDTTRLQWIDSFVQEIKPYIYVREEDSLLILVPNQAHKLNRTGIWLLKMLLDGHPISSLLTKIPEEDNAHIQVHEFFCDIRSLVRGCFREGSGRSGIEFTMYRPPLNTLPILSELAVTYRCNLHCLFCYAGDHYPSFPEKDAPSLLRMIDIIYNEAQVPSISFTGGEPTLRSDLEQLISHAAGRGMWTNLITNATLITRDYARKLSDAGLKSAQVSLEASSACLHDQIVGKTGAYEKTLRGIEMLKSAGIKVHTNTTLNQLNAEDAGNGFIPLLKSLGLSRFSMNLMIPCGSAIHHLKNLRVSYSQLPFLLKGIKDKARGAGIKFLWYSPTPYCLFNPIAEGLGNKSCAACDGLLSLAPDGSVLPCSSYNRKVGNLLETPFRRIWQGVKAGYFKEKRFLPGACRGCEHAEICSGACPLYWKAYGMEEIRHEMRKR